jgi:alpha-amylase/alpha-mannosidase (GH57 family)
MAEHALCIHGHFYQPPREDPISGIIPPEAGASPYHNWNERIQAECYRPNAELENFARISFNLGPTLGAWMQHHDPQTARQIVTQDRANIERYGVGNAIAQAYNHTILPLASYHDKHTQVAWGIAAFEHGFGRKPQGMWLPETAVDVETLCVLAEHGIEFTILAPWQADTSTLRTPLDPTEPYLVHLPQGKCISVFFYQRELSSLISFSPQSTINADVFAQAEILTRFNKEKSQRGEPQILLIATDGELYGHHQVFRDHFLAHLVNGASTNIGINKTYPALWLRSHPPRRSISVHDKTSWSCHHGVLRWMGECSCTPEYGVWKAYLRRAFDRLAEALDRVYVDMTRGLISDPWALRDDYIQVLLGNIQVDELVAHAAGHRLAGDEYRKIRLLLEAQYERQRMYTSCGWYFDDFARIEPKNNVAYAAQAVWLTRLATGIDLSSQSAADLAHVISQQTGARGDRFFRRQMQRAERNIAPRY